MACVGSIFFLLSTFRYSVSLGLNKMKIILMALKDIGLSNGCNNNHCSETRH